MGEKGIDEPGIGRCTRFAQADDGGAKMGVVEQEVGAVKGSEVGMAGAAEIEPSYFANRWTGVEERRMENRWSLIGELFGESVQGFAADGRRFVGEDSGEHIVERLAREAFAEG